MGENDCGEIVDRIEQAIQEGLTGYHDLAKHGATALGALMGSIEGAPGAAVGGATGRFLEELKVADARQTIENTATIARFVCGQMEERSPPNSSSALPGKPDKPPAPAQEVRTGSGSGDNNDEATDDGDTSPATPSDQPSTAAVQSPAEHAPTSEVGEADMTFTYEEAWGNQDEIESPSDTNDLDPENEQTDTDPDDHFDEPDMTFSPEEAQADQDSQDLNHETGPGGEIDQSSADSEIHDGDYSAENTSTFGDPESSMVGNDNEFDPNTQPDGATSAEQLSDGPETAVEPGFQTEDQASSFESSDQQQAVDYDSSAQNDVEPSSYDNGSPNDSGEANDGAESYTSGFDGTVSGGASIGDSGP